MGYLRTEIANLVPGKPSGFGAPPRGVPHAQDHDGAAVDVVADHIGIRADELPHFRAAHSPAPVREICQIIAGRFEAGRHITFDLVPSPRVNG